MTDRYQTLGASLEAPASGAFAITPNDATELSEVTRAVYVGTGGDLVVETAWGDSASFANVPGGSVLPVRVRKVLAASTAAGLVGLY